LAEVDRCKPLLPKLRWEGEGSIYAAYLRCLGTLLERTEPDAPKFMHSEAWQIKTCQTALGGWAQMRYAFALQTKQSIRYLCQGEEESGFLEPVPEFYGRFKALSERIHTSLTKSDVFNEKHIQQELLDEFQSAIKIFHKAKKDKNGILALT